MTRQFGCDGCGGRDGSRRDFLRDCLGFGLGFVLLNEPALARGPGRPGTPIRYPLPAGDGVMIDKQNDVILVRWKGSVYAFNRSCPHQNTALTWQEEDSRFQCPKHKSRYQPDGTFISGRATRAMDRLAVRLEGSQVVVDVDTMYQQDKNPREWAAAVISQVQ